jgi:hypothetical protein
MSKAKIKLSKKELQEKLEFYEKIWSMIDPSVRELLEKLGTLVAVTGGDYKRRVGQLIGVKFTVDSIDLGVYEKTYDYTDGKYYFEKKIIRIYWTNIKDIQFIIEREAEIEEGESIID